MRSKFDEQLAELNREMIDMGIMIENSIAKAVEALSKKDEELAERIMEEDALVDRAQKRIESICFNLLIQQQPVAKDLRTITAAMKMVTDMERIGDHAADISEMTIFMGKDNSVEGFEHINKMAAETVLMLNLRANQRDKEKAKEVIEHDDIVDALFDEAKKDIIQMILKKPNAGEEATDLLMAAKYFERIGDHATNIAEWVIYSLKKTEEEQ